MLVFEARCHAFNITSAASHFSWVIHSLVPVLEGTGHMDLGGPLCACQCHLPHREKHESIGIKELTSVPARDCLDNRHSHKRSPDVMVTIGLVEEPATSVVSSITNVNTNEFGHETPAKCQCVLKDLLDKSLNSAGSKLQKPTGSTTDQ